MRQNPYTPFHPSVENFFGREEMLERFLSRLCNNSTQHVEPQHMLIVGDGGIGKTSLLLQFEALATESLDAYCVMIDCGDFTYDLSDLVTEITSQLPQQKLEQSMTARDFLRRVTRGTREGLAVGVGFPPSISVEVSMEDFLTGPDDQQGLMRQSAILEEYMLGLVPRLERPLVVLLDQLGKIYEAPGGFVIARLLHEIVRETTGDPRLLIVAAIRPERKGKLEHWFREEFFHPDRFSRLPLYPLSVAAARQLIREPATSKKITIGSPLVDVILSQAGRHPYFLQLACFSIWEHLIANKRTQNGSATLRRNEVERLVQGCHRDIFRRLEPEQELILKVLALAWPTPLTAMQIKEKIRAMGRTHLVDVDDTLQSLMSHPHRPLKFRNRSSAYSIAHDLLAQYIRHHECGEEQVELAVLQQLVDNAPQRYEVVDTILTIEELKKLWQYREALKLEPRAIALIIVSELKQASGDLRWTRFLIESPDPEVRYMVAQLLGHSRNKAGRLLLTKLANDRHRRTREVAQQALESALSEWTWEDEWSHGRSGAAG